MADDNREAELRERRKFLAQALLAYMLAGTEHPQQGMLERWLEEVKGQELEAANG